MSALMRGARGLAVDVISGPLPWLRQSHPRVEFRALREPRSLSGPLLACGEVSCAAWAAARANRGVEH